MNLQTDERTMAILWAVSLTDPLTRDVVIQRWRDTMRPNMVTGYVGELLAGVAFAVEPADPWRNLDETACDDHQAWWSDCYSDDDPNHWAAILAPVPTNAEFTVIRWALDNLPGYAGLPPAFTIEDVESAIQVLLAHYRAEQLGVDLSEFVLGVAEAAWALAKGQTNSVPTSPPNLFLVPLDGTGPTNYN